MALDLGEFSWKLWTSFSSKKRKLSQGKTTSPGSHRSQGPVARGREALEPENPHWSPHGLGWTGPQMGREECPLSSYILEEKAFLGSFVQTWCSQHKFH